MLNQYQDRPRPVNRCLLAGAALTQFAVHAGLFIVWAPTNAARIITAELLAPSAANSR